MRHGPTNPIQKACERRFPAWTLYARAYSGNRADAEDIVRHAVTQTLPLSDDLTNEADVHGHVLAAIRTSALELLERRQRPVADPSVLQLLMEERDDAEARRLGEVVAQELRRLPAQLRRAIELVLLRRPPKSLRQVAKSQGVRVDTLLARLEEGVDRLAVAVRAADRDARHGRHADPKNLIAYVEGALSGDEARIIVEHSANCAECGDRLGTMMLLRSRTAEAARIPLVQRWRLAATAVALGVFLLAGAMVFQQLLPNPWADHATHETVPGWFHRFFYGGERAVGAANQAVSDGLELLVRGRFAEAIDTLEPLVERATPDPEAAAYLGIARYLTGNSSRRTVDLLTFGKASPKAGRMAGWYLANVYLARGEVQPARRELRSLVRIRDWVGRQAETLLERLDRTLSGAQRQVA